MIAALRRQLIADLDGILAREPSFARALAARALVESSMNFYSPREGWRERAEADAARALSLDPALVEAHVAHSHLARLYRHLGLVGELESELRVLRQTNPVATEPDRLEAILLGETGRCRESLALFPHVKPIEGDPFPVWQAFAITRLHCGEVHPIRGELEAEYRRKTGDAFERPMTAALLAIARLRSGVRNVDDLERDALSADQRAGHFHHTTFALADVRALQGDPLGAVRYLRQTAETGMPSIATFENDPFLAATRKTAEYQALIADLRRAGPGE